MTELPAEPKRFRLDVPPPVPLSRPVHDFRHPVAGDITALGALMWEAYRGDT